MKSQLHISVLKVKTCHCHSLLSNVLRVSCSLNSAHVASKLSKTKNFADTQHLAIDCENSEIYVPRKFVYLWYIMCKATHVNIVACVMIQKVSYVHVMAVQRKNVKCCLRVAVASHCFSWTYFTKVFLLLIVQARVP